MPPRFLPPDLRTGHPEVDSQHAAILGEVERLRHITPAEVAVSVSFVRQYAVSHFAYEEQVMEEIGYPDLEVHRQQHLAFFDRFVSLKARIEREGPTPENVASLADMVEGWVTKHVLGVDKRLAAFIRAADADSRAV